MLDKKLRTNSPGRLSYPIGYWSLNLIIGLIDILYQNISNRSVEFCVYLVVLEQVEQVGRRGIVEKESRKEIVAMPSLRSLALMKPGELLG